MSTNPHEGLVRHLRERAVRTDGPFTLRSGAVSDWYIDARQTTFNGLGARLVGEAVVDALEAGVTAVGGMTMGADPIAVATAIVASQCGRQLNAFSVRKQGKDHGTGGRLVGPVTATDVVTVVDDTVSTGGALTEVIEVLRAFDIEVRQAITLVDRSGGGVEERLTAAGISYRSLVTPADLGVV